MKNIASLADAQIMKQLYELPKETRDSWLTSRYSLYLCLKSLELTPRSLDDLSIDKHLNLTANPQIKASLSHSANFGAAITSSDAHILSVGIDIELSNRVFPAKANKYISHKSDNFSGREIEMWSIKEACFKAASPFAKSQLYLTSIAINAAKFSIIKDDFELSGEYSLEQLTHSGEELICASAYLLKAKKI